MNAKTAYEKSNIYKNKSIRTLYSLVENKIISISEKGQFQADYIVPQRFNEEDIMGVVSQLETEGFKVNWHKMFCAQPYIDDYEYTISVSWKEYNED